MSAPVDYWEDHEVVTIETPENLELRLPLAGIGPRFLALLVDFAIQGVAIIVLIVIGAVLTGISAGPMDSADESIFLMVIVMMILAYLIITIGYPILFELLWNGQTPGKRITGIRVINGNGLPLAAKDVIIRNLFRMVDYLPSHGFVGLISFFYTEFQQRVGDVVAGTVVVREFGNRVPFHWPSGSGTAHYPTSGEGVVTPRLAYAMGSYLSRCTMFEDHLRLEVSGEIIRQLGYNPSQMLLREREGYLSSVMASHVGGN